MNGCTCRAQLSYIPLTVTMLQPCCRFAPAIPGIYQKEKCSRVTGPLQQVIFKKQVHFYNDGSLISGEKPYFTAGSFTNSE